MSQQHPITPPPELVNKLQDLGNLDAITLAYQAGADQELEACVEWLDRNSPVIGGFHLRIDRRPKPPSRKEQSLEAVSRLCASVIHDDLKNDAAIVRRALEALDD